MRRRPVYLVEHESFKPPPEYVITKSVVEESWRQQLARSPFMRSANSPEEQAKAEQEAKDIMDFQFRIFEKSGLSEDRTSLPPTLNPKLCGFNPRTDIPAAYSEASEAVFGAIDGLLAKTGLQPQDIDILVTTCSIFCPTPSMASMVVNHYKMKSKIQSWHLSGMGCSNGVVAINMIADILQANPNKTALFVAHETCTPAFYNGRDKSRLVTNVLFRMGASAMLLSNKRSWLGRAKYQLCRADRIHIGGISEDAFRCIWYGPDDEGHLGVSLGKNVVTEASKALTMSIKRTAPHIMTWQQIAAYLICQGKRWVAAKTGQPVPPSYTPALNQGVQHFLLHAGGAKVLDGMGKALQLTEYDLEPSRAVLYDYGNVSSATTWYTLGYIESVRGVKAGDKVLQVGVGSGIKCGVNVWKGLRDVDELHTAWEVRITPERRAAVALVSPASSWQRQARRVMVLLLLLFLSMVALLVIMQQQTERHSVPATKQPVLEL